METIQNYEVTSDIGDDNRTVVETKSKMIGMVVQMVLEAFENSDNRKLNICIIKC